MRAHCINIYGAGDAHLGDIWLTAPSPVVEQARLILHPDMRGAVSLTPSNVRDLRDACDAFLTELGDGQEATKPPHPSAIPRIPMRHTARIETYHGCWFRYAVHRLHGPWIPENTVSRHRTRRGAQRAAQRWISRDQWTSVEVPLHD